MQKLTLLFQFACAFCAMIAEEIREANKRRKLGDQYEGPADGW